MAKLASILKTDVMADFDLKGLAQILQSLGRKGDKILAHITPEEAEMLKEEGGSGTINPNTGLPEFADGADFGGDAYIGEPAQVAASNPDLYAGGQLPAEGQQTVYAPSGDVSYGTQPYAPTSTTSDVYSPASQQYPQIATAGVGGFTPDYSPAADKVSGIGLKPSVPYTGGISPEQPTAGPFAASAEAAGKPAAPTDDWITKVAKSLGVDKKDLYGLIAKGAVGAGGAILGARKASQAAQQIEAATAEQKALAQPYQTQGSQMVGAAQRGELTPQGQQALAAMQARVAQSVERSGGVGAQQAAAQVEAFRQQLLQAQYSYGIQVMQVGDQIALGAIKQGLQMDQALNTATQNYYASLAGLVSGVPLGQGLRVGGGQGLQAPQQ